jgi:1,4-dihydroxy-2-naphthoate octaprenyltransferase
MFSKSTLLHLRIPFSYFLLPVFLFALSVSPNLMASKIGWVFLILHFLLYPASNGYNSYFDKDEGSIGGLMNPPPVDRGLYWTSLLLDAVAIVLGFLRVSLLFSIMLLIYGLVSKAYSHPKVRLKKYPITGWLVTGLFQGLFTFLMCYAGMNNFDIESLVQAKVLMAGLITSVMLWANYPMTQVYQHEEDAKHGDKTLSLVLGIRGTFYFVGICFAIATGGFAWFFKVYYELKYAWSFLLCLSPVVIYFIYWFIRVLRNEHAADFRHTMWLNFLSATCLIIFFVRFFLEVSHLG